jgi:hypothetical protein
VTETIHKPFALSHILAVNEFLIKTVLFAKCNPDIVLRRTLHDKVLAGHPMQVHLPELPAEKTKKLIPDSWVDLGQLSIRRRYCYCVEQNLTHVRQKVWRETVRKYLYCTPSYKEQFGTNVLTVLVSIQSATDFPVKPLDRLTPAEQEERAVEAKNREHRRQLLLSWTEAEVKAQNRQRSSDMFRFTSAPLDEMTPEELYCAAHWYTPFQDTPAPLILAAKEESA